MLRPWDPTGITRGTRDLIGKTKLETPNLGRGVTNGITRKPTLLALNTCSRQYFKNSTEKYIIMSEQPIEKT